MRTRNAKSEDMPTFNAQQWMIECLELNPIYVSWGPYEDYMTSSGQWNEPVFKESWKDFGPWGLDNLNEVVNFYFEIDRPSKECEACEGSGYNPETKHISDTFYDFNHTGKRWNNKITQDEVDALWEKGRLQSDFNEKPTPEQVNQAQSNFVGSHDAINRWILVEQRAKRLGVYGKCLECEGQGYIYTEHKGHLNLVLWVLHPRKGASRAVEVANIKKGDLPEIYEYLRTAAQRNAQRFSAIPAKE